MKKVILVIIILLIGYNNLEASIYEDSTIELINWNTIKYSEFNNYYNLEYWDILIESLLLEIKKTLQNIKKLNDSSNIRNRIEKFEYQQRLTYLLPLLLTNKWEKLLKNDGSLFSDLRSIWYPIADEELE